jgi:hypothetical protein
VIRKLFTATFLIATIPTAFAQPVICPPIVNRPTFHCPPILLCICPLASAVVSPNTPVVVPERMKDTEKADPKKMSQSEPLTNPRQFATPLPAEANSPSASPNPKAESGIPPANVPAAPGATELPKFTFPPTDTPTPGTPMAQPESAPKNPPMPQPKPDVKPKSEEPAANIPADTKLPGFDATFPPIKTDAQPVEANKPTVSKASPLQNEQQTIYSVYPVDGPAPASPTAKRTIGFMNKSDRDLLLTIDGKMVTIPSKNLLRADLPASFKWQIGGGKEIDLQVPMTAPGMDIIIRNNEQAAAK